MLDCGIIVNKFEILLRFYFHFWTDAFRKCVNVFIPQSNELNSITSVHVLDKTDCISHSTNTLGKGMNPIIPPAMGK